MSLCLADQAPVMSIGNQPGGREQSERGQHLPAVLFMCASRRPPAANQKRLTSSDGSPLRLRCAMSRCAFAFAPTAVEVVKENRYRLPRDIRGIGFRTAD